MADYPAPPDPDRETEKFVPAGAGAVASEMFAAMRGGSGSSVCYFSGPYITPSQIWGVPNSGNSQYPPVDPPADPPVDPPVSPDLMPFNIHGFLTIPDGAYDHSVYFSIQVVPPGNAYRTEWRLHSDACGASIEYFGGDLDDSGRLLVPADSGYYYTVEDEAYFDFETKRFHSSYFYPEGMYLQLGVLDDGRVTWSELLPCIAGGGGTPP